MRQLTKHENDMISIALGCRENLIETNNYAMDAATLEKMHRTSWPNDTRIKALSTDQMQLLINSRKLKQAVLEGKLYIQD